MSDDEIASLYENNNSFESLTEGEFIYKLNGDAPRLGSLISHKQQTERSGFGQLDVPDSARQGQPQSPCGDQRGTDQHSHLPEQRTDQGSCPTRQTRAISFLPLHPLLDVLRGHANQTVSAGQTGGVGASARVLLLVQRNQLLSAIQCYSSWLTHQRTLCGKWCSLGCVSTPLSPRR